MRVLDKITAFVSLPLYPSRSAVVGLLFAGSPAAISRHVITVIVDAINRQILRTLSHICVKVLERMPSFANLDPTPAVIRPAFEVFVPASIQHIFPHAVDFCAALSVCCADYADNFITSAPARRAIAAAKRPNFYHASVSAFANTVSKAVIVPHRGIRCDHPAAKLLADAVFQRLVFQ